MRRIVAWPASLLLAVGMFCKPAHSIGEGILDVNVLQGMFKGLSDMFNPVNTTEIDVNGILGKWHQMYRAAINFDVFKTQFYCPVMYIKRNPVMGPIGFVMDEAFHVIAKNGPIETYKRDVSAAGPGKFWVHTEQYFYPHQMYILKAGPVLNGSYQYLVASDQNRLALSVLARDPIAFVQRYDEEVSRFLKDEGFGGEVFWNQPVAIYHGNDCFYPSEREVFARRVLKDNNGNGNSNSNNNNNNNVNVNSNARRIAPVQSRNLLNSVIGG